MTYDDREPLPADDNRDPAHPRPGQPEGGTADEALAALETDSEREMAAIRAALTQADRRMILRYALRTMPAHVRWWELFKAWILGC